MAKGIKTVAGGEVVTCVLKFPDGQQVSGRIRQGNGADEVPIVYSGAVDRLGVTHPRGKIGDLLFLFELNAKTTGATLIVSRGFN